MKALADEIVGAGTGRGVSMWWLGQAGIALRGSSGTVVIDAFLTDFGGFGRTYEPPIEPVELTNVDLLLGTHDHVDHIDPLGFPAIMEASPSAVAVVPAPAVARVTELGIDIDRIRPAFPGTPIDGRGVRVTPFPAVHAPEPEAGYGFHAVAEGHPFLGYLVELDNVRVCHTGDTLVYDGLGSLLASLKPDVLFVPINGRSWYREQRGVAGNMNTFEAAELAEEVGARITIPIHWDLFADNTEDPTHFARYAAARHPDVRVLVPELGVRIDLGT